MQRDDGHAQDILLAARRVVELIGGMTLRQFQEDRTVQEAVLYNLLVLGEAANRLSGEFRRRTECVPWRECIALRNRLIHDYGTTRLDLVWQLTRHSLPELIAALEPVVPKDKGT